MDSPAPEGAERTAYFLAFTKIILKRQQETNRWKQTGKFNRVFLVGLWGVFLAFLFCVGWLVCLGFGLCLLGSLGFFFVCFCGVSAVVLLWVFFKQVPFLQ